METGCKAIKESQVSRELEALSAVVSDTQSVVDSLRGRLSSIIKPCVKTDSPDVPEESIVPLADRIRSVRRAVEIMKFDLQDMINSCEL